VEEEVVGVGGGVGSGV